MIESTNFLLTSETPLILSDRRLYNYLLLHALNKLPKLLDFNIPFSELEGVYGTGLPPIDKMKESLKRLMRTLVEFEVMPGKWILTNFLSRAEVDEVKNQLFYSYPATCRELFSNPFTLEKCLIQAHFTQKYSNLLYDILATAHYAKQTTFSIDISDLRNRLHIPENKLTNFNDFSRFVLTPALDEVNSFASFAVKYQTQRKGMKVIAVVFEMTTKRNISGKDSAKKIIPPKRPKLFIDDPDLEWAYAYLLNAETHERRKFFDLACKLAAKNKEIIEEEKFDRPDLWFKWVAKHVLKNKY